MTTNLKSEILDNINNIALGVNTDSSLRNKLLVQLEQAESTNAFDFKIDVNFINRDKKSYVAKYLTIHQLNKIGNSELKQLRDRFQESYLQVQWKSKDKESKSKIDALRDALNSYVPISINKKTMGDILIKKNNSYFTGANNSKVRILGDYVYKYAKPLNSSDLSECGLTFSETLRCARGYYKSQNLDGGTKANEFDTAIKRAIAKITEDKDSEEPFEISSGNSQTYVSNLVVVANQWLSQLRQAREDKKKEIRGVKEEIKNTSNKTKVKKAS